MNKTSEFSGLFYPEESENLQNTIDSYKQKHYMDYKSKAIIVPHAGYIYSGHAAMSAFEHLEINENIFIIAPTHHYKFNNIVMPDYSFFETPLGEIEVNTKLIKEISKNFPSTISNDYFNCEHSIEVQIPFIQHIFSPHRQSAIDFIKNVGKKIKIIPILTGICDYRLISDIIATYWDNASFIISSDLSHYYTQEQCRQIDTYTATIIETGKTDLLEQAQACGVVGIKGLVHFAQHNNYSMIRTEMYNSGDISNDKDKVVGYGGWFLFQESKNNFIEKYCSKYILNTVKKSIEFAFNNEEYKPLNIPTVLTQFGASFITLKKENKLRGCIGSIYPTKPLILDIIDNAKNAAFRDSRFEPLTIEEWDKIEISVSILSSIEKIDYKDKRELLSKIYPHGIIITERDKRAVYLPIVWEQLPDREIFFNSLKEKAGFHPEYFSTNIEVYKFDTSYITEDIDE